LSNINKYLLNYAEDEISFLSTFPKTEKFKHIVVIPAYKETFGFIERFFAVPFAQQNILMVLVINQPDVDPDITPQQQLSDYTLALGKVIWSAGNLHLVLSQSSNSAILLVDRFTQPIKIKLGVGLARKIGADIATALINSGCIQSHWIASTDADASLPADYFSAISSLGSNNKKAIAGCFNFTHQSSDKLVHQANAVYEKALRYYVAGLCFANSNYALFTIGSILVFKATAYASVRGFPKRSAGEDFYLLNKLAKIGEVDFIEDKVILLEARESDRVPFGTGPAVSQIMVLNKLQEDYFYYHPQVFSLLKTTLAAFAGLYQYRQKLPSWYDSQSPETFKILSLLKFEQFIEKQKNVNEKQFTNQLNVWFDAFKTLKFIHHARDLYFPNIALTQALKLAPFEMSK